MTENEGITEDTQILEFLRKERQKREEEIREAEKTKKHAEPIVAYEKGMPNILHHNQKPKPKTLEETWRDEDEEARLREEER